MKLIGILKVTVGIVTVYRTDLKGERLFVELFKGDVNDVPEELLYRDVDFVTGSRDGSLNVCVKVNI